MKKYLIGFAKGFGIGFVILSLYVAQSYVVGMSDEVATVFLWILSFGTAYWFIHKYNLTKSWLLVTLVFGALSLPFIAGNAETKSSKNKI